MVIVSCSVAGANFNSEVKKEGIELSEGKMKIEWIDGNFGKERLVCPLCQQEKDTTEHVLECCELEK